MPLSAASAHADADEVLAWLRAAPRPPRGVFVTHGEPDAADALRLRIERELGWHAQVPDYLECVDLLAQAEAAVIPVPVRQPSPPAGPPAAVLAAR